MVLNQVAARGASKISAENFPVALRVLPRRVRDHLQRAYVFARFVDDVGDEAAGDRLALLDEIDRDVQALPEGRATLAPVQGLLPLVRKHGLSLQPLHDLVEANRRDQTVSSYPAFDDLLDYCRLSAAPIGRIVLSIAGVDDPRAAAHSDKVCAALQVLEHCQDVGEDAARGRVYLPQSDLRAHAVAADDLRARSTSPELRRVIAIQVLRAEELLTEGIPLVRQLRGWARLAVLGYVAGGRATAAALRRAGFDVLPRHVAPGKLRTARYAALTAVGR
jgi:squalene synthase HpnC